LIDEGLGYGGLETGKADVEARSEKVAALSMAQVDFGIDRQVDRQSNPSAASRKPDRAFEAGRPTGRKQLLRISADAR
jgi:hypothetical protein